MARWNQWLYQTARAHLLGFQCWRSRQRVDLEQARALHPVEWRWLSVRQLRRLLPSLETKELVSALPHLRRGVCTELFFAEYLSRPHFEIDETLSHFPSFYLSDLVQRAETDFVHRYAHHFLSEARCRILAAAISSASDPLLWREKAIAFLRALRQLAAKGEDVLPLYAHFGAEQLSAAFETLGGEEVASLILCEEERAARLELGRRLDGCEELLRALADRVSLRLHDLRAAQDRIDALCPGELSLGEYHDLFESIHQKVEAARSDLERMRRLRTSLLTLRSGLRKAKERFSVAEGILRQMVLFVVLRPLGQALLASPLRIPFEEFELRIDGVRRGVIDVERQQREIASILGGRATLHRQARDDELPPRTAFRRPTLLVRLEEKAEGLERPKERDDESWILPLWEALSALKERLPDAKEGLHTLLGKEEHRLALPLLRDFVRDRDDLSRLGVSTFAELRIAVEGQVREMVVAHLEITEEEFASLPWEMIGCSFKSKEEMEKANIYTMADLERFCRDRLFDLTGQEEGDGSWRSVARQIYCEAHV